MMTKDINEVATKCAEIFIKANLKHIKLENIHNQKQKYSEYYANGEMPESDFAVDLMDFRERIISDWIWGRKNRSNPCQKNRIVQNGTEKIQ